ncbi:MAG: hypothetical protein U1F43_07055 [Myxococcota bacterium]
MRARALIASSIAVTALGGAGCSTLAGLAGGVAGDHAASPTRSATHSAGAPAEDEGSGSYFEWPPAPPTPAGLAGLSPWDRGVYVANVAKWAHCPLAHVGWWLDSTPGAVSQSQRLVFVKTCLSERDTSDEVRAMAEWAYCKNDIAALDRKAFEAEVKDVDGATKKKVLHHFDYVASEAAAWGKAVAASTQGDPGAQALTQSIPDQALAADQAERAPWSDALAAAVTIVDLERANSRSALAGCDATIWPHVERWIREHAAATDGDDDILFAMQSDTVGHILAMAMHLCVDGVPRVESYASPSMGPRMAVLRGLWAAKVSFDRTDRKLGDVPALYWREPPVKDPRHVSTKVVRGVVDSVTPVEGGVRVVFKKTQTKYEECVAWRETDKFDGFTDDGHVRYREVCTKSVWKTDDTTPQPIVVAERFEEGVAKGRVASFLSADDGKTYAASAVHASADPKSKVVARYGVGL